MSLEAHQADTYLQFHSVTSIVEEQGCFQTELRIAGNSNKLIYFS